MKHTTETLKKTTRGKICVILSTGREYTAGEIKDALGVSTQAVYSATTALRELGLVERIRVKGAVVYRKAAA